ncbi:GNAT family N-acetyltransferase [Sporosarcina sp. USHLN248]|uniref:GNAT family N-acetyltransferase n=1 Tax=Sporosarcina sp. USHLN248 TaxID=3081300 RepID=UPI00301899BA
MTEKELNWSFKRFNELSGIEVYEMLKLRVAVFVVEQQCPYMEVDGHDMEAVHLFGMKDGEIKAYARLLPAGVKYEEPSLGRVIVHEDQRGKGVSHILISKAVEFMIKNFHAEKIQLQAQLHLQQLYGSHGFEVIGEPYEDDGIPHIDMLLAKKSFRKVE